MDFEKNDWNHLHDCIIHINGNKSTKKELEQIFKELPEYLKNEAYEWGMNDTLWREKFIEYYTEKLNLKSKI